MHNISINVMDPKISACLPTDKRSEIRAFIRISFYLSKRYFCVNATNFKLWVTMSIEWLA